MENVKLCNVGPPTLPEDGATKSYVDEQVHSTLEAANKRLATEIQELREQAELSNRLNATRMVRLHDKTSEEISAKYDEKLKSLWRALNAHIGSPEQQGPPTALAAVPDV